MRARIRAAACLIVVTTLCGCGFHLRGSATRSDLGVVQVTAVHSLAATPLVARAFARSGVRTIDQREGAAIAVVLLEEKFTKQTVSYTDQARTAEYEVTLTLVFRATRTNGDEIVPDRQLRASRIYRLDPDDLQGSSQQEELLRGEMSSDLGDQIVRAVDAANRSVPVSPAKAAGS